jgi:hypothetical protein
MFMLAKDWKPLERFPVFVCGLTPLKQRRQSERLPKNFLTGFNKSWLIALASRWLPSLNLF